MSAWMIRAGHGGVYAEDWLDKKKIGINWDFGGKDIASMEREQIRATYLAEHPNDNKNRVAAIVGQVYRFAHEMTQGQTIVMYDPASRLYHIGAITGDCVPTHDEDDPTYTRTVRWNTSASRDALKRSSKNSLGGIQTIFAVSDEVMNDLQSATGTSQPIPEEAAGEDASDDNEDARAATYDNGIELIKDRVNQLDWEDMERLVAGLLKAMGYCARITPKGPDGGRDVIASPDALGLESPRIVVEVKHRKGAMEHLRSVPSLAAYARTTADFMSPPEVSPEKPDTRRTAPMFPCVCSTSTDSSAIMLMCMTRPMRRRAIFCR